MKRQNLLGLACTLCAVVGSIGAAEGTQGAELEALEKKLDQIANETLFSAIQLGNVKAAKVAIEEGGANVNARDAQGFTPLMRAGMQNDLVMVRLLVGQGADSTLKSNDGFTAMELAKTAGADFGLTGDIGRLEVAALADQPKGGQQPAPGEPFRQKKKFQILGTGFEQELERLKKLKFKGKSKN